ncbi:MAG: hypothetical protein GY801_21775 [bacterium]|nr:hypothetical protein [bacterium]
MAISGSSMPRTADLYAAKEEIERLKSRSRGLSPEENEEKEKALKKAGQTQKKLQRRVNLSQLLGSLMFITVLLAIIRALPEGMASPHAKTSPVMWVLESFAWLLKVPAEAAKDVSGDFASLLAPFMSVAFAIERLLETSFSWFEQSSRAIADILVAPRETLDWIGREYQEAYEVTKEATATIGAETTPESFDLLNAAEERLAKAEARLRGWVNAPEYIAWKKALSIWFGLLIGLVIAVVGDLGMLRYLGIATPRFIDMILTGLILGAGPGPMHDLIGLLQGGKNAIGSLSELAKGKAIREAAEALQRETDALQRRRGI